MGENEPSSTNGEPIPNHPRPKNGPVARILQSLAICAQISGSCAPITPPPLIGKDQQSVPAASNPSTPNPEPVAETQDPLETADIEAVPDEFVELFEPKDILNDNLGLKLIETAIDDKIAREWSKYGVREIIFNNGLKRAQDKRDKSHVFRSNIEIVSNDGRTLVIPSDARWRATHYFLIWICSNVTNALLSQPEPLSKAFNYDAEENGMIQDIAWRIDQEFSQLGIKGVHYDMFERAKNVRNDRTLFRSKLRIVFTNGRTVVVHSDGEWRDSTDFHAWVFSRLRQVTK